tara:strand:- start:1985 stop:2950 length:966 start_codon:yes stop_codon:yes gene_type:complete
MKKNIKKISNKIKILVIGDLMLDEYLYGNVERVSPEAPVPIVRLEKKIYSLGGAGNVSNNISSLGAKVSLISLVGNDENSKIIDALLKKKKIDKFFVLKSNKFKTIVKSRILSQGQQVLRLDNEDDIFFNVPQKNNIFKNLKKKIKNFDCVIVSDYGKGVCDFEVLRYLIELANYLNIPVFADPRKKNKNFEIYRNSFCITPNMNELNSVYKNVGNNSKEVLQCSLDIKKRYNIKNVLVTRGEKGISLLDDKNKFHIYKSMAKEVYDVSGAGDTVISTLATLYCTKMNFKLAAKISNLAASVAVSHKGTYQISKKELAKII